jgi:hypothetical protein
VTRSSHRRRNPTPRQAASTPSIWAPVIRPWLCSRAFSSRVSSRMMQESLQPDCFMILIVCRNRWKAIEFGRRRHHRITVRMARKTKTGEFAIVSLI